MLGVLYTGRYAPSPTGRQHYGNLRTALVAWLHARVRGGQFLVRMEDLDRPRVVTGSASQILADLTWLGIDWDGEVIYQSHRTEHYQTALAQLTAQGLTYPCFCSRKDIQLAASAPHVQQGVYPNTCASLSPDQQAQSKPPATRLRVSGALIEQCGDFVIRRADNVFAYQLAVVVDDLAQGISDVVRGEDLLDSTARQCYLAAKLQATAPAIRYHHVPLMSDDSEQRLAKRNGSHSIAQWQDEGKTSAQLVGYLARSLGLLENVAQLSANELLQHCQSSNALSKVFRPA